MRSVTLLLVLVCGQAAQGQSTLVIEANTPGYGSLAVEQTVLAPLEQHLNGTEGVQRLRGLALDGKCFIQLDLTAKANPQLVRMLVENRVSLARTALPPLCTPEILPQADGAFLLLSLEPGPKMTLADTSKWVKLTVWPLLANVPGVAHIRTIGAVEERVRITLDPNRLQAYKLAVGNVVATVQASRNHFAGLSVGGIKVRLKEKEGTLDDLKGIPINAEKNVYLRNIASVIIADEPRQDAGISRREGKGLSSRRAVFVQVQLAPGKLNPLAKQGLEKAITKLRTKVPDGMDCETRLLQADDTTIVMRLPDGSRSESREKKARAAVRGMMELPQVQTVFWTGQPDGPEVIFYVLADGGKQADLRKSLRAKLAGIEGTNSRVGGLYSPLLPWPGQGAQFVVRLQGKDLEKLQKTAEQLRTRLGKTPGIVDVDHFPKMRQEVAVEIDRERMALAGVQPADIVTAMHFQGQPIFGWPWPITVAVPVPDLKKVDELGQLALRDNGAAVTLLRDVAAIRTISAPSGALHEGGQSCVIVFGNVEGRTLEEARADIRRITQELAIKGVKVELE